MRPEGRVLRFAGLRTWRLLLPLLFGMFIIVPIQPYCEGAAVAGRQFCRLAVRHHLEPPVVPGLPVELHAGAGPADAGAGQAWGAQDRGPCCRIAHAADRHSVRAAAGLGGLAGADLPVHQCPARRLVPAREVRDGVPRRLPVWPRARVLGSSGRPAPHHAVAGACRSRLVHGPAHPRPGAAGRLAAASVARSFLGPAGPDQPVAVRLDRAAGHPRLGQGLPRPPVPLAAVLHRGDLSLVHAAPEPDHRAVVLAQAAAAWRVDRAGAAARRHRGRLPADPRAADPSRALAAAAVRPACRATIIADRTRRDGGLIEPSPCSAPHRPWVTHSTVNSPTSTVSARSFSRIVTIWSFCFGGPQCVVRRSIRVVAPVTSCWRLPK
ncbi:hypothetical protein G6F68_010840 [Rhizopus microsporus]|nr:hypothetical protein G6F68_010840 [Rhizopus microsporus]